MSNRNLRQLLEDFCETDLNVRKIARKVLTEFEVNGDSWGVPPLEDIVELLVERIKKNETI